MTDRNQKETIKNIGVIMIIIVLLFIYFEYSNVYSKTVTNTREGIIRDFKNHIKEFNDASEQAGGFMLNFPPIDAIIQKTTRMRG